MIWSTSLVTREVSVPRRSDCWCSIDRSWMWRKVRVRTVASAVSLTVNSRRIIRYEHIVVMASTTTVAATMVTTTPTSGPPGARRPRSITCCTAIGTATRPTMATTESARVPPSPTRSSGERDSPRRMVCQDETGAGSASKVAVTELAFRSRCGARWRSLLALTQRSPTARSRRGPRRRALRPRWTPLVRRRRARAAARRRHVRTR